MSGIDSQSIESIREVVSDMLIKMGVNGQISERLEEQEGREILVLNIKTDDAKLMIGQAGDNLLAFQYVVRLLFRKKSEGEVIPFTIDVNNYRQEKADRLRSIARSTALKVRRTGAKEVLPAMPAYDRRVVHTFLAEEKDLMTVSYGEEPKRRVVVKLAEEKK